jgi:PIN domain nuclease of toxin-antitoxin system
MKLLLDTHILLWYRLGNSRLSIALQTAIANEENELWLSPISIWEILILAEKGRLMLEPTPEQWIQKSLQELDIKEANLTNEIAILSRQLDLIHQDPADRFIAATAVHYGLTLATVDANLTQVACLNTLS